MEQDRFDRLARALGVRIGRRRAAGAVALGAIVAGRGLPGPGEAEAKRRCKTVGQDKVKDLIRKAAKEYKQPYDKMLCVAQCESSLNNCAVNKAGKSYGLFQFKKGTWEDEYLNPKYRGKDLWDPKWSALATAYMWSKGNQTHWDCCCPKFGCDCPGPNPPWC